MVFDSGQGIFRGGRFNLRRNCRSDRLRVRGRFTPSRGVSAAFYERLLKGVTGCFFILTGLLLGRRTANA